MSRAPSLAGSSGRLPPDAAWNRLASEFSWRGMFPPEAPVGPDVDFAFLAKQFPISGGEIKNVVLAAAFLAVKDGRVISMKQVIEAMARHCLKSGRALAAVDFKQYHEWIESSSANGAYVAGDT